MLEINHLEVCLGSTQMVRDVSLQIAPGEMLGLVGESGCGKSLTALSVMNLLDDTSLRISSGEVLLEGKNVLQCNAAELNALRGAEIAMIFQEPMTSLNPVFRVGAQIMEALHLHKTISRQAAKEQAVELLERVGVASPGASIKRYPHQLSGGQRQRVMIAMALACEPKLLIADEPTSALDVTVQAQILELLDRLRQASGMAILFITHDLGVVRQYCDSVAVMYSGQIVEQGQCDAVFEQPGHPYTHALLNTMPAANLPGSLLPAIAGTVPKPACRPPGCAFAPRCDRALKRCEQQPPVLDNSTHPVRCWNKVSDHPI